MKTFTNKTPRPRLLMREWDNESGEYSYFWAELDGTRKMLLTTGPNKREFRVFQEEPGTQWNERVEPGCSVRVPAHRETFAQCASRTGEFRPMQQARRSY